MYAVIVSDPRPSTFGERVRSRRETLGLSQKAVADAAGVKYQFLARIERGGGENPTLKTLRVLARVLECTVADLIGDDPAGRAGDDAG